MYVSEKTLKLSNAAFLERLELNFGAKLVNTLLSMLCTMLEDVAADGFRARDIISGGISEGESRLSC